MADSATSKLKAFARQLVACEAATRNPSGARDSRAFCASEKLRVPLGKLVGISGFRALLTRALALGGEEAPVLLELHIKADGSLEYLDAGVDPRTASEGEVVLLAHMAGLLVTFIGPALTVQMLRDIWPDIDDADVGTGETP